MDPVRPAKGWNKNSDKICSKILIFYVSRVAQYGNAGSRYKTVQVTDVSRIKGGMRDNSLLNTYRRGDPWSNRCCNLRSTGQ